jgi:hypothetical protein
MRCEKIRTRCLHVEVPMRKHLVALAVSAFLFTQGPGAMADSPQFKAGDRIDVDRNMNSGSTPEDQWKPGTVRKISDGGYWVELDENPGQNNLVIIPIREGKWARPSQTPPPENGQQQANGGNTPANQGVQSTGSNAQFRIGDRVDVDRNMHSDGYAGAVNWSGGTIKKIADGGYWVELDGQPGAANWVIMPIRNNKWVRSGTVAPAPPAIPGKGTAINPATHPAPPVQPPIQVPNNANPVDHADTSAHIGPHAPTEEHVKMMVRNLKKLQFSEYATVDVQFNSVQIGRQTRDNRASAAYARRVGVDVYPVHVLYSVHVKSAGGTEHKYEYEQDYFWYIDTRHECTLDLQSGAGFKRQVF